MAGTVTTTEITHTSVKKVTFDWLSAAGGTADATTTEKYTGTLYRVVFIPDTGDTQPDNNYSVTVNDSDSADVLNGGGATRSNAATSQINVGLGSVVNSALTLGVTGAGAANGGQVILYIG